MGSMHLGGRNSTAPETTANRNGTKSQNNATWTKIKTSPGDSNKNNTSKLPTRIGKVGTTAKERGQAAHTGGNNTSPGTTSTSNRGTGTTGRTSGSTSHSSYSFSYSYSRGRSSTPSSTTSRSSSSFSSGSSSYSSGSTSGNRGTGNSPGTPLTQPLKTVPAKSIAPQRPRLAAAPPPPHATNPSRHKKPTASSPPLSRLSAKTAAKKNSEPTVIINPKPLTPRLHPRFAAAAAAAAAAARRPPLLVKQRDQDVDLVPTPIVKENRIMGHHEAHTNPATTTSTTANARPQMPSLSASAVRGINRMPLTPKIAAAVRPPQPQTPNPNTTAANTPLPRRSQPRPTSASNSTSSSNHTLHDDHDTPPTATFGPHLSSNVTPRSGSRQSRVESANSTPNSTPNHDRPEPWDAKSAFPFPSPLNQIQGDPSRRPLVTFSAVSPERNSPWGQDAAHPQDSKFFHASDVKPLRPAGTSKGVSPKTATFFYANGNGNGTGITPKAASPTTLSPPLSPGSSNRSQESVTSKFMYANGTPELQPTPPSMVPRVSASAATAATKGPVVRSSVASQRPSSPSKLPQSTYKHGTGQQAATATVPPPGRVPASPTPPLMPPTAGRRRPGTAASRPGGHSRSGSWVKVDGPSEALRPMASPITGLFPPASLSPVNHPPLTLASIIQAAEDLAEHENEESPDDQSPTKSPASPADPVTELIANARRERKVQDLQIRNTSLEAINRTLERQLRKQTTELRRFRRLSRANHISLASTNLADRVPSGAISELELESLGLSDPSEEDMPVEEPEEESPSDTDSASSGVSASVLAERDAKHRPRDEERLQVDLSKHQQMLTDSQKLNQSIRRCMNWTEELIKAGKKALEYKVRVSDVQLGGRVLDPLDEEEENTGLMPSDEAILDFKPLEGLGISTS
ncbi:hypothetical protein F5Y14DRAFT_466363 [Nemania sp. NC0429]|nr:hypothetical protein F5Y14DRAFT_466363 [Nemania sp. NC0429]